jgi:protein-S-isoprenylcysteine O-methyltransferase Ste14
MRALTRYWNKILHGPPLSRWRIVLLFVVTGVVLVVFALAAIHGKTTSDRWLGLAGVVVIAALLWLYVWIVRQRQGHQSRQ